MKKLTTVLAVMTIVFGLSGKAQAVPYYYTFEGTVSGADDAAGAIAAAGLYLGAAVTYTFTVDFDADGTLTYNDGSVVTYTDSAAYDLFYTDYVSGDALVQVDGGYFNADQYVAEYNYGYDDLTTTAGRLHGNFGDSQLIIYSLDAFVSDWAVGAVVAGQNRAFDSTGAYSQLSSTLTLLDISPVSVPEPSTLLLLGSGMLGLLAFRRRQLTTQA